MLEAEWTDATNEGIQGICSFVEDSLKSLARGVVESQEFSTLWGEENQVRRAALEDCLSKPWQRMSYTDAVEKLQSAPAKFHFEPIWGQPLRSEHEKWLAEEFVKGPVFVVDYPKSLKPFYMRENTDGKTVACFDLLVPHAGELAGGSVREERLDRLDEKMRLAGMDGTEYAWYRDLRRFGGSPHGGYGLGFERLVSWLSGIENVRECIPVPRWAGKMLL